MNVMLGEIALLQTAVVPLILAVGKGLTVITAVPVCAFKQLELLASRTLIRV